MLKKLLLPFLFVSFFLNTYVSGQIKKFSFSDKTTMQIQGTSTLHDWTCNVTKVDGAIEMDSKVLAKGIWSENSKIKTLKVSVPVESIKSPRGAAMEKKLYNALKSEKFPLIVFTLNNIKSTPSKTGSTQLEATGTLNVAGVEKPVSLFVNATFNAEKNLSFAGSYSMNMKDFDVEPPSAMFGQIVSGEKVTISFNVQVNKLL
jgi:polyisoprenoid-binding protein YceI